MMADTEVLYEVHRITKRSALGETMETEYIEDRWVPLDEYTDRPDNDPDLLWAPKGSWYTGMTIRSAQ